MEELKNEIIEQTVEQAEPYKSGSMQCIESREVAEIVEKKHKNLLADITRYSKELTQLNFQPSDYFIESTYKDSSGKCNKCYLVTKKGCEFIAHKLTGLKGTKFTATYINRFHDMEECLSENMSMPSQAEDMMISFIQQQTRFNEKIMEIIATAEHEPNKSRTYTCNPFSPNTGVNDERIKNLNDVIGQVAELCNMERNRVLHYLYLTLEERLQISFSSYLSVYRAETGDLDACNVQVIASNDRLYKEAVTMCQTLIERKRMFG